MRFTVVSINWTAQPLSTEQLLVLRNIAALFLRQRIEEDQVNFTHSLLEGRLIRKSHGLFVSFVGTIFEADLGTVNGERWTVDFLLPVGSEYIDIDDKSIVLSSRMTAVGEVEIGEVDKSLAKATDVSLLK